MCYDNPGNNIVEGDENVTTSTEDKTRRLWEYMNQETATPPTKTELQAATKLAGEIDVMMTDYKERLEKLRRADVSHP